MNCECCKNRPEWSIGYTLGWYSGKNGGKPDLACLDPENPRDQGFAMGWSDAHPHGYTPDDPFEIGREGVSLFWPAVRKVTRRNMDN